MGQSDRSRHRHESFIRTGGRVTLVLVLACAMDALIPACAGPPPVTRPVCGRCEDETRFVRVAKPEPALPGPPAYEHPLRLSREDWRNLLGGIYVQKRYKGFLFFPTQKGPVEPAFLPEEIDYLSMALSLAFDQAQPGEWVVFGLSRPSAPELTEVTTGACFVKDGQLHVRFANYRYAVSMQTLRGLLWEHPLHAHEIVYELVPGAHQAVITEPEGPALFGAKPVEVRIAYQAALAGPPPVQPVLEPRHPHQPHVPSGSATIEERLRTLKRLREEGLLSEDEYRTKRQQVLEQF